MEVIGNNRSVMLFDELGCMRATMLYIYLSFNDLTMLIVKYLG